MKKILIIVLLFLGFVAVSAQSAKSKVEDFGTWDKEVSPMNKISISSYITKQENLKMQPESQRSILRLMKSKSMAIIETRLNKY